MPKERTTADIPDYTPTYLKDPACFESVEGAFDLDRPDLFQQLRIQLQRLLQFQIVCFPKLLKFIGAHKKDLLSVIRCCFSLPLIRLSFVATFVSVIPRISAMSR